MKKEIKERIVLDIFKDMTLQKQLVFVMVIALLIAAFSFLIFIPQVLKPFYEQNIFDYLKQPASYIEIDGSKVGKDVAFIIKTKSGAIYVSNNLKTMFGDEVRAGELLEKIVGTNGKFKLNSNTYYYYVSEKEANTNIVFTNDSLIKSQEKSLIRIILPTMTTTTLIIMILIYAWSNHVVYKIKRLKYKTENIASDSYKEGEHFTIDDELNMLSKSIDMTRKNLKDKEEYKNYMFQNLSHELKTPISVIDSYIEAMQDEVVDNTEGMKIIAEQTTKLKEQVNTLLCFNKIDYIKEQTEYVNHKVEIISVIKQSIEKYKLQRQDVEFVVIAKSKDIMYQGTEDMWQTAIDNILANFIRYANSKIIITIKKKRIEFFNDGEQIEDEVINNIFSPYTKGKKGQTGLGLSIVKRITEAFGYEINVQNMHDGVLFVIGKETNTNKNK